MNEFQQRRARWLREVHARTTTAAERKAEDLAALRGVEFRVLTYEQQYAARSKKNPAPSPSRAMQVARASPGSPPSPSGEARVFHDQRDWYELLIAKPRGERALVPGGAMFFGGDRAWRCEVGGI